MSLPPPSVSQQDNLRYHDGPRFRSPPPPLRTAMLRSVEAVGNVDGASVGSMGDHIHCLNSMHGHWQPSDHACWRTSIWSPWRKREDAQVDCGA